MPWDFDSSIREQEQKIADQWARYRALCARWWEEEAAQHGGLEPYDARPLISFISAEVTAIYRQIRLDECWLNSLRFQRAQTEKAASGRR